MTYTLLLKKLYLDEKKMITSDTIKGYCKKLNVDYYSAIRYLIRMKYVHRILKGIFYMPGIEERKLKRIDINHMEALTEALKIKKVGNWYCGMETALKLNNLTHEFFTTDFIVNDTIFRAKPIKVLGHNVKFIKLKKNLFGFGIITKKLKFSDLEKTVLDMIYLSLYRGLNAREVKAKIADLWGFCSKRKMNNYVKNYSKTVEQLVKEYDKSN